MCHISVSRDVDIRLQLPSDGCELVQMREQCFSAICLLGASSMWRNDSDLRFLALANRGTFNFTLHSRLAATLRSVHSDSIIGTNKISNPQDSRVSQRYSTHTLGQDKPQSMNPRENG
jgi:hypothetical protein